MTVNHGKGETSTGLLHITGLWWRVLRSAYLRFSCGGGLLMAAAIAFFSLICLAPLGVRGGLRSRVSDIHTEAGRQERN